MQNFFKWALHVIHNRHAHSHRVSKLVMLSQIGRRGCTLIGKHLHFATDNRGASSPIKRRQSDPVSCIVPLSYVSFHLLATQNGPFFSPTFFDPCHGSANPPQSHSVYQIHGSLASRPISGSEWVRAANSRVCR
jgi:hypothetical protein